jgi:hypothetical protein
MSIYQIKLAIDIIDSYLLKNNNDMIKLVIQILTLKKIKKRIII